jgi:pimeloyl-ACP methyl ester carboxylesterase
LAVNYTAEFGRTAHHGRSRSRWLLAAVFSTGLLASGAATAQPVFATTNPTTCITVQVPVTIPGVSTASQIIGDFCWPLVSNGTLLLMVGGGGGENADYWNMPGLSGNSLVDAANAQSFATFAIDRIGTGRSTVPDQARTSPMTLRSPRSTRSSRR